VKSPVLPKPLQIIQQSPKNRLFNQLKEDSKNLDRGPGPRRHHDGRSLARTPLSPDRPLQTAITFAITFGGTGGGIGTGAQIEAPP
jgi:hypothetical protein